MGISLGIIFGFLSMLGYGLANAITKVPATKLGSRKAIFFRGIVVSAILLIILIFYLPEINFSPAYIIIALGISVLGYAALVFLYTALKLGKIGIVTPIAGSAVLYTVLFSIIFFKETLTRIQVFSILLIIIGVIFISTNFRDLRNSHLFKISSGIPFAFATSILWGLVYFLFKIPVNILGPILTSFLIEFGVTVLSGIHLKLSKIDFKFSNKKMLVYVLFLGIFVAAGTLFYNLGIKFSDVSIIAAISFSNPLIATLYGKFVFKERLRMIQYGAIMLIMAGIVMISYF